MKHYRLLQALAKISKFDNYQRQDLTLEDVDDELAQDDTERLAVRASIKQRIKFVIQAMSVAIRVDEIPAKYKHLKLLGRGKTALVYALNDEECLVFTRDSMKAQWLMIDWGLGLGKYVEEFKGRKIPSAALRDTDIQVIKMPRLYPLNSVNKKIVRQELVQFATITHKAISSNSFKKRENRQPVNVAVWNLYADKYPDSLLTPAIEFAANFDAAQFSFDFHMGNFLQDKVGKIVVVDPFISEEIFNYVRDGKKS